MRRGIPANRVRLKGLAKSGHWPSGNPRFYFRRPGDKAVPLPDLPKDDPRFIAAWVAAIDAKPILPRRSPRKGTIASGVLAYRASQTFAELAPATREYRNRILSKIEADYGPAMMADLEPRHIRADLRRHAAHAGNQRLKVWRALCRFWVDQDMIEIDPAKPVSKPTLPASDGHIPWTRDDVTAFRAHWRIGTMQRLALELILHTGAAIGDAVRLGPGNIKNGWITYKRGKTGVLATCPLDHCPDWFEPSPQLRDCIDAAPRHMVFLSTASGHSRSVNSARQWFAQAARAAGIEGKSAHGVRKLRAIMMAEAGATTEQRMAIMGHDTTAQTREYSRTADAQKVIMGRESFNFPAELKKDGEK
jgi:integrase